jgi:segregation and condensation protein B
MAKPKQSKRGKNHEASIASAVVAEAVPPAENAGAQVPLARTAVAEAVPHAAADEVQAVTEPSDTAAEIVVDTVPAGETAGDAEADVWAQDRVEGIERVRSEPEDGATDQAVWAESSEGGNPAEGGEAPGGEVTLAGDETAEEVPVVLDASHMESIIESLLFASDKVLGLAELKRLLGERDGKKVTTAVEALLERRKGSGIEVMRAANGWHLRTNPEHARWVSKLLAGRPMRLSRAMMETLAIVAYRQPCTRPEIDQIRGVDCGPVLKTLLDRGLIRIIGKKEEVGRPLLYGTTPEFLRVFSLGELSDLPTLREYAELSSEQQARVEAEHGPASAATPAAAGADAAQATAGEAGASTAAGSTPSAYNLNFVPRSQLPDEPEENDPLLDELESASKAASKILGTVSEPTSEAAAEPEPAPATPPREPTSDS